MANYPIFVVLLALVALAQFSQVHAAISCNTIGNDLSPCLGYVLNGGVPTTACCRGAKSLLDQASTRTDRIAICNCLKSVSGSASPFIIRNAAGLPGKCGITIPYQINPSADCSTIQ